MDDKKTQLTQDPKRSKLVEQPSLAAAQVQQQIEQPPTTAQASPPAPVVPTVRIKLLRDCVVDGTLRKAGERVGTTEEEATRVCRDYPGVYNFFGALDGQELAPVPIQKARRLEV